MLQKIKHNGYLILGILALLLVGVALVVNLAVPHNPEYYTEYNVNAMPEMTLKELVELEGEYVTLTSLYVVQVDYENKYTNIRLIAVADHPDAPLIAIKNFRANDIVGENDIIEVQGQIHHVGLAYGKLYYGFEDCKITVIEVDIE